MTVIEIPDDQTATLKAKAAAEGLSLEAWFKKLAEGRTSTVAALDWSRCPDVESVPGKVSGAWVFRGTRVPLSALFENLEGGATVEQFLAWFPGVQRAQVEAVLEHEALAAAHPDASTPQVVVGPRAGKLARALGIPAKMTLVPVSEAEQPVLYRIVGDLAMQAGLPMPRLYVSPSAQPNAFATGRNPAHAAGAVTEGILPLLGEDELRGVLAHELSHVANRDILIGSVAAAVAMAITFLARIAMWSSLFGGRRSSADNPLGAIGLLAFMLLAPLAAVLMQLAVTRSREYGADWSGAELLGDSEPLARALEKLEQAAGRVPMRVDPAHATAYIVNPLAGPGARRSVPLAGLFATHPPVGDRVRRLRSYRMHELTERGR